MSTTMHAMTYLVMQRPEFSSAYCHELEWLLLICCNVAARAMPNAVQLRQVMREGLIQKIPVRQFLENKFEAALRCASIHVKS